MENGGRKKLTPTQYNITRCSCPLMKLCAALHWRRSHHVTCRHPQC